MTTCRKVTGMPLTWTTRMPADPLARWSGRSRSLEEQFVQEEQECDGQKQNRQEAEPDPRSK